jgi:glutathione-regulated potassium-efflux system ancillary protein KefC/glutathione-regulated potassium-efflux system protein KefB
VLLGLAAWLLGVPPGAAAVVGFGLALSSTPLVLQVLAERGQLKAHHGRSSFGILLFQDLAVLPALTVLPLLAPAVAGAPVGDPWWIALGKLVAAIALIVLGGRYVMGPALRVVARVKVSEVFTAAALLVVIGTALLVNAAGLSMALGAFLAGVLLADSEFRHELEADIEPFKGLLLGLFFIAVGMSANLGLLAEQPVLLVALTFGLLGVKLLAIAALGRATGHTGDAAWRLGFSMASGGEFAFVLFTLALGSRLLDPALADLLVLVVTLSMMLGPVLLVLYDAVLARVLAPAPAKRDFDTIEEREGRVLIAGFGRFGQIVGRVLRARRIPFTALDANQTHIDFIRRFGNRVYYGDASRLDLLRAAGAERADVLVIAIDDVEASLRLAEIAREHFPKLRIYARARNRQHAFALMDRGVKHFIRETYGSSLEMAAQVLEALGEPASRARETVRKFREHDQATLLAQYAIKDDDEKLVAKSREAAAQLERLFEADTAAAAEADEQEHKGTRRAAG